MGTSSGLRDFIDYLKENGELLALPTPLSPKFEISTILSELGKKEAPALLFEKVKGHKLPVIGNLLGTKRRLSMALGVDQKHFFENALSKLEKRIPPAPMVKDQSPKEVITQKSKIDLLKLLPILTHYTNDSGPYITSGVTSARDPKDGTIGRGLHRMEVRGRNELGISLINPPLSEIYAQYKKENKKMQVATVIGVEPAILIASVSKVPRGTDKLSVAGGLRGNPAPMVKAQMSDLDIPDAEIVIEGFIDPKGKEKDGTLGESSGYYMTFSKSPTIHVTAVSYRKGAYFHSIVPWGLEVDNLLCLIHGIDFVPKMKKEIPSLKQIHFIPGTFGSHVVMSIETDHKGEIRRALCLALSSAHIKKAVMVDEDVNPEDDQEVEWAMATRFQGDRDLIAISDLRGQPIDPSSKEGFLTTKIGMDATRPKKEGFKKVDVPIEVKQRLAPILKNLNQISYGKPTKHR